MPIMVLIFKHQIVTIRHTFYLHFRSNAYDNCPPLGTMSEWQMLARIFHKTGRISLNPLIKLGLRQ